MSKRPAPLHAVVVTVEQGLLLDMWTQFAYEHIKDGKVIGLHAGGLSALESLESYLLEHHLMSKRGNPYKQIAI